MPQGTVGALLDSIQTLFSSKKRTTRVEQLRYVRGEPLVVEKSVLIIPVEEVTQDPELLSPFQSIRNRALVEDMGEVERHPLRLVMEALDNLRAEKLHPTLFVTQYASDVVQWSGHRDLAHTLGMGMYEDLLCPENSLFVAGSSSGDMTWDVEKAIMIRMG